jgi:hypothetical protein
MPFKTMPSLLSCVYLGTGMANCLAAWRQIYIRMADLVRYLSSAHIYTYLQLPACVQLF